MQLSIEEVLVLCQRKGVSVDAINLSVGTMMIDRTGIVGRGSTATALVNGIPPAIQSDEAILTAAETFVIHYPNGMKSLFDRPEFEEFCKSD